MPATKLTLDHIEVILTSHKEGMCIKLLARVYGVSYEQIRRIVRGERWVAKVKRQQDILTHKKILDHISKDCKVQIGI